MLRINRLPQSLVQTPARLLMAGEAALFALAVPVTVAFMPLAEEETAAPLAQWHLSLGLVYAGFMLAVMHALGMHVIRSRHSPLQTFMKYVCGGGVGCAALWLIIQFDPAISPEPGRVILTAVALFAATAAWRAVVSLFVDSAIVRRNILVLGAGRNAAVFNEALRRRADRRGLEIVGFVPAGDADTCVEARQLLHIRTPIARVCERNNVQEIVVATDHADAGVAMNELLECRFRGVPVTQAATFIERECGRIPIELADPNWWLFRDGFVESLSNRVLKRAFDLIAGTAILLLATPVMLMCALAIKLEDGLRSSIFYRQRRVGRGGKVFSVIKFRSMREDAEKDGVARWATADDDRVTRVGAVLRKMRLDELPQLFNVIRGEMSLVGPRPERPEFVRELSKQIPYYERRHVVRPGITGWAQLCYPYGASTRDALEKLKFDLYYIKNFSLLFDLAVLLRTVEVVLFGKGAR